MINELKAYIEQNNLHDKAIEYFWAAFNNWKHDHSEDFEKKFKDIPIDSINVFVHSIGLRSSEWPDCDYNHGAKRPEGYNKGPRRKVRHGHERPY